MKKLLLYLTIFFSLFVGTASMVVLNSYSGYLTNQTETNAPSSPDSENMALSGLANNILTAESYSGDFNLKNQDNSINLNGNFTYYSTPSLSAEISVLGKVNELNLSANLILLDESLYITYGESKLTLNVGDIVSALNEVMTSFSTSSNTALPTLDMSVAQELLSKIKTTKTEGGYLISGSLPNLLDLFIVTDNEYLPTKLLVTNLKLEENIFTLELNASTNKKEVNPINKDEYLNISPALNYLSPLLNTINQKNVGLYGKINLGETSALFNGELTNNEIIGTLQINNFLINLELSTTNVVVEIYNKVFTLSYSELFELMEKYLGFKPNENFNLNDFVNKISLNIETKDQFINKLSGSIDNLSFDFELSKSLIGHEKINTENALRYKDIVTLIESYQNLLSTSYSLDLGFSYNNIEISGKAFVELSPNFNQINNLYFSGRVLNLSTTLVFTKNISYIQVENNKLKLENATIEKVISTLLELAGEKTTTSLPSLDFSMLNNVNILGKTITYNDGSTTVKISSYNNSFKLSALFGGAQLSATLYPNEQAYSHIKNKINPAEFKDFSNADSLVSALVNTFNSPSLDFDGTINLNLKGINLLNINVRIKTFSSHNKIQITLTNLPTTLLLTKYNSITYYNAESVITIQNGRATILSSAINRFNGKTEVSTFTSVDLAHLSIDNIGEIFNLNNFVLNQIKSNSASTPLSTNFSTDVVDVLKTKTNIDLTSMLPSIINEAYLQFNYQTQIDNIQLNLNIKDWLYISMTLNRI